MIVNARPLSPKAKPPEPELPYEVTVTAKDELNALNIMLTSAGELMVDGVKIIESGQQIQTTSSELIVTYTMKKTIGSARVVTVNESVLGTVKSLGDAVEITIPKTGSMFVNFSKAS